MMDKSEVSTRYDEIECKKVTTLFDLVEYHAPTEAVTNQTLLDFTRQTYGNFSIVSDNGLHMTDYREAFITTQPSVVDSNVTSKTIEEYMKERVDNGYKEEYLMKNYTWGNHGLIDPTGNIVKGFAQLE